MCRHRILLCAVSCYHLEPSFCVWFRKAIIFILLFLVQLVFLSEPPGDPTISCVKFVFEGDSVTCDCQARFHDDHPPDFSLSWPGHPNSPSLLLSGVTRRDNGTVVTCLMMWNGHRRTANYTLQVAYGPDNTHTTIEGPSNFFTNGTASLTLTCRATDVNPPPLYNWDTDICKTEDKDAGTCTFTPDPAWDDGRKVQCSAIGRVGGNKKGVALFTINLTYPPKNPPVIIGFTSGTIFSQDTQLRCKVSGGKPAVSKVIFTCERLPRPYTGEPSNGSDRTEAALTVNHEPMSDTNNSVLCTCRAVWEPREDMYTQTSQILLQIDHSETAGRNEHVGWLVGILIGAVLGGAVALVLSQFYDFKKCRKLRAAKGTDPTKASNLQLSEMINLNDTRS